MSRQFAHRSRMPESPRPVAFSERHPLLSVVIPCANEQEVLRETNARLLAVLQQISLDFEIVYVKTLPFL
jgi:hypothetical protein